MHIRQPNVVLLEAGVTSLEKQIDATQGSGKEAGEESPTDQTASVSLLFLLSAGDLELKVHTLAELRFGRIPLDADPHRRVANIDRVRILHNLVLAVLEEGALLQRARHEHGVGADVLAIDKLCINEGNIVKAVLLIDEPLSLKVGGWVDNLEGISLARLNFMFGEPQLVQRHIVPLIVLRRPVLKSKVIELEGVGLAVFSELSDLRLIFAIRPGDELLLKCVVDLAGPVCLR